MVEALARNDAITSPRFSDASGKEVFIAPQVVVVPASYLAKARKIAIEYMQSVEKTSDREEQMLPTALSATGKPPATHFACFRDAWDFQLEWVERRIAEQGLPWCLPKRAGQEATAATLKGAFLIVSCTRDEFLARTGLVEIK